MYKATFNNTEIFTCSSKETLLQSARKQAIKVPFACRGGGCGVCKVKVVDGDYRIGPSSKAVLSDEERKDKYVLACKTYPLSNLTFQLINSGEVNKLKN